MLSTDAMNKFCKSNLCVENVSENNVLIRRLVVDVPGCADAILLAGFILLIVKLRLCREVFTRWPHLLGKSASTSVHTKLLASLYLASRTC